MSANKPSELNTGKVFKDAEKLFSDPVRFSEGWNFGPHYDDVKPVDWILDYMTKLWPNSSWQLDSSINPHEANLLKLDISKAEWPANKKSIIKTER